MAARVPTFLDLSAASSLDERASVTAGLLQPQAVVASKYFYDRVGSALFTAITTLPEYYPTRCEAEVFAAHKAPIADALHAHMPAGFALVDLGAGDGAKASRWFAPLQTTHYVAVDISAAYLQRALLGLQLQFPALPMTGVTLDFSQTLALPEGLIHQPALMFYPGSSISNFDPAQALRLLREMHSLSHGGALLIGADLMKPVPVLHAAYDDELGVTSAFNLNLLRHLNGLIGSDFMLTQWQHHARVNEAAQRVEMHLRAREDLTVHWADGQRAFAAGQTLHTENSYKWEGADFESLLRDAGWRHIKRFTDARGWFGVFLAMA
jgi:L-histidine Nalpha-methyltransferase